MPRKNSTHKKANPEPKITSQADDREKIPTGLYSLDAALGGGLPTNAVTEIYGWAGSGKTTLLYYLMGKVNPAGKIALCETENGFDAKWAKSLLQRSGFYGELKSTNYFKMEKGKKAPIPDDDRLDRLFEDFSEPEYSVVALDSVGGYMPTAEAEGDTTDALMGLRARQMAKFMRKAAYYMRYKPCPCHGFVITHMHAILGGRGVSTIGGDTITYLSSTRIRLSAGSGDEKEEDGSMIVRGKFDKLRFRQASEGAVFQLYFKAGYGIHPGLSAVLDAIAYELATKENGTVKMKGKSYGRFSKMLEQANDDDLFQPFQQALEKM